MHDYSLLPPLPVVAGVEFRHVPGYFGYCAGDNGDLLTALTSKKSIFSNEWKPKKHWRNRDGYFLVSLRGDDGREHRLLAHTVILLTFVGPRPKGYDTLHENGIRDDNRLANIRWGTRKENMDDARRHGTLLRGERNHRARLSNSRARAIRDLRQVGWTIRDLADLFDVSTATICGVANEERWVASA